MARVRARIGGRVQGVGYRFSTEREAKRLGLTGWVRNERNGSVALEAQGAADKVEALIAWCRRGPPGARVSGVDVEELSDIEGESGFEIRH
jgi:acylphosphatase